MQQLDTKFNKKEATKMALNKVETNKKMTQEVR